MTFAPTVTLFVQSKFFAAGSTGEIISHLHSAFDGSERGPLGGDEGLIDVAKLVVHEWVANLIQHADFGKRHTVINVRALPEKAGLRYAIEDNSAGFDLIGYLGSVDGTSEPLPARGMGLLMINACCDEISYRRVMPGRNQLEIRVTGKKDASFEIGLGSLAA